MTMEGNNGIFFTFYGFSDMISPPKNTNITLKILHIYV
jgi:hypothetical protein